MKKQSMLFIAGALITLASCQNNTDNAAADQAQIDSIANARAEELRMQMQAQNDSIINAEAQRKADSIAMATKPTAPARTTNTRPATPSKPASQPETPATSPTRNPKQDKLDKMTGTSESGTKKEVTPEDTKKKKDKLKEMGGN